MDGIGHIVLIITVCLVNDPSNCHQLPTVALNMRVRTVEQCAQIAGMKTLPEIMAAHPNFWVKRWECADTRQLADAGRDL